jgi:hypothetical protein
LVVEVVEDITHRRRASAGDLVAVEPAVQARPPLQEVLLRLDKETQVEQRYKQVNTQAVAVAVLAVPESVLHRVQRRPPTAESVLRLQSRARMSTMQAAAVRRRILEAVSLESVVWGAEQTERTVPLLLEMQELRILAVVAVVAVVASAAVVVVPVSSFSACTPTSGRGCSSVMDRDTRWLCRPSRTQSLQTS